MSEEDTQVKKEFVTKPKGTIKHEHCQLIAIDMESTELKNKSGWCIELDYKSKFQDKWEAKSQLLPGSKYEHGGLKVPANKRCLEGFKRLDTAPKKAEFTLVWLKGDEYWDLVDVLDGHVGRSGYQVDPAAQGASGGSGNFSVDAAAGQLINIAVAYLAATKYVPDDIQDFFDKIDDFATEGAKAYQAVKETAKGIVSPVKAASKPTVSETTDDSTTDDTSVDDPDADDTPVVPETKVKAKDKPARQRPATPPSDDFD
jgi:hypothetical protein